MFCDVSTSIIIIKKIPQTHNLSVISSPSGRPVWGSGPFSTDLLPKYKPLYGLTGRYGLTASRKTSRFWESHEEIEIQPKYLLHAVKPHHPTEKEKKILLFSSFFYFFYFFNDERHMSLQQYA